MAVLTAFADTPETMALNHLPGDAHLRAGRRHSGEIPEMS